MCVLTLTQQALPVHSSALTAACTQVHLMAQELFDELEGSGHKVLPGQLGENITVRGLDVLNLPQGTRLAFGDGGAVVQVRT